MKREFFSPHERIKGDKPSQKNKDTKVMNKALPIHNKAYMSWLHEVLKPSCFSCGREYYNEGLDKMELHHPTFCTVKNDEKVIALCGVKCHSVGVELSAHSTPKKFRETYTEKQVLTSAVSMYIKYLERSL